MAIDDLTLVSTKIPSTDLIRGTYFKTGDLVYVRTISGDENGIIDESNSSNAILLAGETFVGEPIEILKYSIIYVSAYSDQDSAVDGLIIEQGSSYDGGLTFHWYLSDTYTMYAGIGKTYAINPSVQYFRVRYVNGGVDQTDFHLITVCKTRNALQSSHRIQDIIVADDDAILTKSLLTGKDVNTGYYVNVGTKYGQVGNNLLVSVDQVEQTTNSLKVIDYAHAELHGGDHFIIRLNTLISKNGTYDILFITPNTIRWSHFVPGVESLSSSVSATLYESPTTTANGTAIPIRNRNRNTGDGNNTLLAFHTPTVTSVGTTILGSVIIGSGKNTGGSTRDSEEFILKQNTKYLLRITEQNIVATKVNYSIDWYEHTNR